MNCRLHFPFIQQYMTSSTRNSGSVCVYVCRMKNCLGEFWTELQKSGGKNKHEKGLNKLFRKEVFPSFYVIRHINLSAFWYLMLQDVRVWNVALSVS